MDAQTGEAEEKDEPFKIKDIGKILSSGGEVVALDFAIELTDLKGRDKLKGYEVMSLVQYDI